jgi:hypothetical protein
MKTRRLNLALMLPIAMTLALPCAAAPRASAPVEARADQLSTGSIELTPTVTFSHSSLKREGYANVDSFTQFDFDPTVGFCFTNHLEAIGGLLIRHESINGDGQTVLGASAGLTYNFEPQGKVIPFLGAGFGTFFNDGFSFTNTSVLAPALTGGIRMLVGNKASVNMSLGYEHETDGQVSTNRVRGGVGVSLFPWRMH